MTEGYKGLKGVTGGDRELQGLQKVTSVYRGLQGVTELKGVTEVEEGYKG